MHNFVSKLIFFLFIIAGSTCKQSVQFEQANPVVVEDQNLSKTALDQVDAGPQRRQSIAFSTVGCQSRPTYRALSVLARSKVFLSLDQVCTQQQQKWIGDSGRDADIMFLIDISGSMQKNIDTIRGNIERFINSFSDFRMRVGIVAYVDEVHSVVPLTDNLDTIRRRLGGYRAEGGKEYQEAGLLAIKAAARLFRDDALSVPERRHAEKIILIVTNSCSHSGDPSSLAIGSTVAALNDAVNTLPQLRFYYSVPISDNEVLDLTTGVVVKAHKQMASILHGIQFSDDQVAHGGIISYPFNQTVFINEFANYVKKSTGKEVMNSCEITAIELQAENNAQHIKLEINEETYSEQEPNTTWVQVPDSLIRDSQRFALRISRCCKHDNASICDSVTEQRLPFNVVISK